MSPLSYEQIRSMTEEELGKHYNLYASGLRPAGWGVDMLRLLLDEIARRQQEKIAREVARYTRQVFRLTLVVAAATVVMTVATIMTCSTAATYRTGNPLEPRVEGRR